VSGMPECGRMTWAEAAAGPLAGATCLWQDLDGLHVAAAPATPPATSILWGWHGRSRLIRVRLDGDATLVAVFQPDGSAAVRTVPWDARPGGDGRVAGVRGPAAEANVVGVAWEQVADGDGQGAGPVTFIRPAGGNDG
jgi:hypothetical protein